MHFAVYRDRWDNPIVTLPRDLENILGGSYRACRGEGDPFIGRHCGAGALPVQNGWYEFSPAGPGNTVGSDATQGIRRIEGRFTTFADWDTQMRMRLKFEVDESPGGIVIFRGTLNGNKVYSTINGTWAEGFALTFTNATTVTSTEKIDNPPYQIIKPVTKGRVRLYAVDDDDAETLVGYYDPDETNPSYARFVVPACVTTEAET